MQTNIKSPSRHSRFYELQYQEHEQHALAKQFLIQKCLLVQQKLLNGEQNREYSWYKLSVINHLLKCINQQQLVYKGKEGTLDSAQVMDQLIRVTHCFSRETVGKNSIQVTQQHDVQLCLSKSQVFSLCQVVFILLDYCLLQRKGNTTF